MAMAKWFKRSATVLAVLAALWVATWLVVPPLVKWQAPTRLQTLLGRDVTLGAVDFHPWALEIVLHDLAIGAAPAPAHAASGPALIHIARLRANVALSSIFRRAPVIEAIDLDAPRIALTRTAPGHYDIDDLIRRFTPKPDAAPSEPARFALYNLQVRDLQLRFDDKPTGRVHTLEALNLSLPFLSNLPAQVDVKVQPHLSFRLDGAAFDSAAQATPFARTNEGDLTLALSDLDVRPWLGYLPDSLPVRLVGGTLSANLALAFKQPATGAPSVVLKGWVAAHDVAIHDALDAPLLAWRQVRVGLRDVEPLAHRLAFDSVRLDGVQLHLDRDAAGAIDPLRSPPPAATPHAASAPASNATAAPATAETPWQVTLDTLAIADSQILWNDAAVKPAAALRFDALTLAAQKVSWPTTAPIAFTLAANIASQSASAPAASASAPAHLAVDGKASEQSAQVSITLSDLALQTLAPYIAQSVVPHVDGRLAAQATVAWAAETAASAARLQVSLAHASLDDLRIQLAGAVPAARLQQLAVSDLQLDVPARTVAIADVKLVDPMLQVARDANGEIDATRWLRAPAAAPVASAASVSVDAKPWHVQVRSATLDGGLVQFSDASLHPQQNLPPLRAELRQVKLAVQDFAWFGNHATPAAKVQLDARIGRPAVAGAKAPRGGELGWKGKLGLSPLQATGNVRVVRFPIALVTPWVADRLPLSLLRAEAGYTGRVDVRTLPAGIAVRASGDALLGDVHLTTLATVATTATPAATPEELLSWQSLSLKKVRFAMTPNATPRLDIAQVELDDLYSRLVVTEQGRFNLQDIGAASPADAASAPAAAAAASVPAAVASEPASAASAPLPIVVTVGGIKLVNARVDYTDRFVRPNYSAALTELNGSLGAFSSATRDMATLQLHGRAEGTAILDISGQVNPLAKPLALDIEAKATDLELAPLSPYAGKYAGYAIERGKLSMDVAYKIAADGRLEARNQVILNQLTFGDAIESPTATKLPVRLAVALLKDRNGVIDINLPISGSVNDPQFSVGGIVVKLLVNLLVKAVTSPFSLLSGGGGGSGPDMSAIEFRPGSAVVTDAGAAAMDKVAQALIDRPALQMTITGAVDPTAERADAQRESVEARLQALARSDALRAGAAASAPANASSAPVLANRGALLKTLYAQTRMPDKPRNLVGLAKDIPDADMEALLRKNTVISDETMRQQALARAIAVRDALVAKGVGVDRLFLASPKVRGPGDADPAWKPQASLELATR
jgi:uncharacterized protein involved in outer membrane biogenesis